MVLRWFRDLLIDPEFNRKRKFLQRISLFHGISRREFGHLFQVLVSRACAPGEILFHEGDVGRALFILEAGHVEISARTPEGGARRIAVLNPGDYFGEMALLDDRPRVATAAAMEPARASLLYKADLEKLIRTVPHIGAAIMLHLSMLLAARIRAMTETAPISIASTVPVKEAI
jgi:CRP/FNR family transcriptional regulator, cyclic AMP receptor protein